MGSLFTSLLTTAGSIQALDRVLDVIQNNVANASTPGYAAARLNLAAEPFDPNAGSSGGVKAGTLESTRDEFVEQSVWEQQNYVGEYTQKSQSLAPLEQVLGVTSDAAIPSSLNQLFQSFSALATAPNDSVQRQQTITDADQLVSSFNAASKSLANAGYDADQQIQNTVDQINQIVGQVQSYNLAEGAGSVSPQDAGADSQVYASLENLSQLVDFTVQRQPSGQFDIELGNGQAPLLLGSQQFQLKVDFSQPQTQIRGSDGTTVTAQVQSGQLAALLDTKNNVIPSYSSQLDQLAAGVADQVNVTLASGIDKNGNGGTALFSYDAGAPAATLSVTSITPDEIAAATADAPGGSGNATNLANLVNQPVLNGENFAEFYGSLAGRVGQDKASADQNQQLRQQLLTQAQSVREQTSGVSLDEEATRLIQFQRAYQASAQLLSVLSQLTGTIINMLQP